LGKIRVTHRSRLAAAIVVVMGMTLATSAFPATAATSGRDLVTTTAPSAATTSRRTTSTDATTSPNIITTTSTTGPTTTGTSTIGPSTPGTSTTAGTSGTGGTSQAGLAGSAGDTVVTVGQTLSYNEGEPGACTWWAIYVFHAYTGLYPDFFAPFNDGNAGYWGIDAAYDGWTVTSTPRVNSIAVFPPGVDGADYAGHVAWVTAVSGSQITISEMNGAAGWDAVDIRTLTPAPSVAYILAP
jgi:peptidoglycan DL-endopeptidase CwlO